MKILSIVGARPNFMKIAPISDELKRKGIRHVLVHTGQHYDYTMSQLFFEELGLPVPDIDLGVGSGTHAWQTAEIIKRFEPVVVGEKPDLLIVVGDVNSTIACAMTAVKLGVPVAHVEAGLRSFDRTMPEEINRILTDSISDFHFTTEESANDNLRKEGISDKSIFFVGNTMIDTLLKHMKTADLSDILKQLGVHEKGYGVLTLHRPSNVDDIENLSNILKALAEIARDLPLIFPVHPRTRARIGAFGLSHLETAFKMTEPLGYLDFMKLVKSSSMVFTDSGGIQEETTVMGIPCITLRSNTERPVTVTSGTNVLAGADREKIIKEAKKRLNGFSAAYSVPPLWDGHAAERIVEALLAGYTSTDGKK